MLGEHLVNYHLIDAVTEAVGKVAVLVLRVVPVDCFPFIGIEHLSLTPTRVVFLGLRIRRRCRHHRLRRRRRVLRGDPPPESRGIASV